MILSKFSERLEELLFENGLNPPAFANALGLSRHAVNNYLHGSIPTVKTAVAMADFFHCTLDFLLGLTDESLETSFKTPPPFHERFPVLLEEFGISRYKLQQKTQLTEPIMRHWWKGAKVPTLESIVRIAEALGCSVDYVIGRLD